MRFFKGQHPMVQSTIEADLALADRYDPVIRELERTVEAVVGRYEGTDEFLGRRSPRGFCSRPCRARFGGTRG